MWSRDRYKISDSFHHVTSKHVTTHLNPFLTAKMGYFFSFDEGKVRGKGVGRFDLYNFDLYKEARPQQVAFIEGNIKDHVGNEITDALVEIKNIKTDNRFL